MVIGALRMFLDDDYQAAESTITKSSL